MPTTNDAERTSLGVHLLGTGTTSDRNAYTYDFVVSERVVFALYHTVPDDLVPD